MLKPVIDVVWPLVDSLYIDLPAPTDDRKPKKIPLNEVNFAKKEFQALWGRINHKAVYQVEFDSAELVSKCVQALDRHLNVAAMQYVVQAGQQRESLEADDLASSAGFDMASIATHTETASIECARKFFASLNEKYNQDVMYHVVTDYTEFMQLVAG